MNATRDPLEDLLREVITGDRAESDAEVQAALRAHPELRARLGRLRTLSAQLDAAGALQRDVLAAPGTAASASLPAIDIGPVQRRLRHTRRGWLAAAVAVVGLGALAWWTTRTADPPGVQSDPLLGEDDPWPLALDRTAVPPGITLRWQDPQELIAGQEYEVHVFAPTPDAKPVRFLAGETSTWTPNATELQSLPDPFCYEVHVVGLTGPVRQSQLSAPMRR